MVQFALAPFTSWGIDTPGFIQGVIGLMYRGNPYFSYLYFNPPLAPFLQLPFFAVLTLVQPASAWIQIDPHFLAAAAGTGIVSASVPTPGALLSLKAPMILAAVGAGIMIFRLARQWGWTTPRATWAASAWLLNPLVIWATAVHGEADALAALLVLWALYGVGDDWPPALVGLVLGLGFFAKFYPVLFVLPVLASLYRRSQTGRRGAWMSIGGALLGFGVAVLPFFGILRALEFTFLSAPTAGPPAFGGMTVLLLFNHQNLDTGSWGSVVLSLSVGEAVQRLLIGLAAFAVAASTYLILSSKRGRDPERLGAGLGPWVWLWVSLGAVLVLTNPQPENLLALLPFALLAAPVLEGARKWAWGILTTAGTGLYLSFVTPLGFFFPAIHAAGDGAAPVVSSILLQYSHARTVQLGLWNAFGLIGGLTVLALWVLALVALLPPRATRGVKRWFGR